jgi:hypothetical protein
VYAPGKDVYFTGSVSPNVGGEPLYFTLQKKRAGAWKSIKTFHYKLYPTSSVTVDFVAKYLAYARPYRIQCFFLGDGSLGPGVSKWSYFIVKVANPLATQGAPRMTTSADLLTGA